MELALQDTYHIRALSAVTPKTWGLGRNCLSSLVAILFTVQLSLKMAAKEIKAKLKAAKSAISEKQFEKALDVCKVR